MGTDDLFHPGAFYGGIFTGFEEAIKETKTAAF